MMRKLLTRLQRRGCKNMYRSDSKEYVWKTVDLLYLGGVAHAYQQKYEVRKEEESDYKKKKQYGSTGGLGLGLGIGVGLTVVPKDEHRLKEMKDTLNEESIKKATQMTND